MLDKFKGVGERQETRQEMSQRILCAVIIVQLVNHVKLNLSKDFALLFKGLLLTPDQELRSVLELTWIHQQYPEEHLLRFDMLLNVVLSFKNASMTFLSKCIKCSITGPKFNVSNACITATYLKLSQH